MASPTVRVEKLKGFLVSLRTWSLSGSRVPAKQRWALFPRVCRFRLPRTESHGPLDSKPPNEGRFRNPPGLPTATVSLVPRSRAAASRMRSPVHPSPGAGPTPWSPCSEVLKDAALHTHARLWEAEGFLRPGETPRVEHRVASRARVRRAPILSRDPCVESGTSLHFLTGGQGAPTTSAMPTSQRQTGDGQPGRKCRPFLCCILRGIPQIFCLFLIKCFSISVELRTHS